MGGAPPSSTWWGAPPPTPACRALGAHAAWGCPPFGVLIWGTPPFSILHVVHWERTLLGGYLVCVLLVSSHPLSCMPCAGSARCLGGAPSSSSWFGDPPRSRQQICWQTSHTPDPWASLYPLMGEVRPLQPLWVPVPLLPPPPHRFVLQCGASADLGDCPHLLYQSTHKGRALLIGRRPSLPYLVGRPPTPPASA